MIRVFKKYELTREDLALKLLPREGSLLDVGCSQGSLIFRVRDYFNHLCGIDIAEAQIEKAKKRVKDLGYKNISFQIVDIDQGLPFEDNSFDVVTCISVLQFVFDPYFIMKELHRVLKNKGFLIIDVPNIAYLKQRIKLLFGILPRTSYASGWDGQTLHYFTLASFRRLLKETGFQIQKVSGCGIFAQYRNWWPSFLTGDLMVKAIKQS